MRRRKRSTWTFIAERINQLGGKPNFNPDGLTSRAASQYSEGETLVDMIRENLVAERIAIEHYRDLIRYFGDKDPTTRTSSSACLPRRRSTPTTCTTSSWPTRGSRCSRSRGVNVRATRV